MTSQTISIFCHLFFARCLGDADRGFFHQVDYRFTDLTAEEKLVIFSALKIKCDFFLQTSSSPFCVSTC